MPRGTAVLSPRRQGEEVVATGAGLHHQLLEAGDQAGLGGQQGTGAGVPGAAIPPSSLACPSSNPGLSPQRRPPLPVPSRLPQALTRMHLHGVRGLVQQRHVQALHAVCAAAVGAPKPVHLVLERGGSSSSSEPPSPSGPRAGLGPLLCPPPGPWHLSDADGGLRPWPDAEPVVLQEGRVVVLVNHGPDASLRGQQREVVLLLGPEDQADPWGRPAVRPGRQEPPARARPGPALTVGDAWALRDPAAVEGVAAAVGGVVESPEVPGTGATLRPARGFAPAPVRAARGATACLIWKELFATGRPPGWPPPCPYSPGLAVLAIIAAREDKAAAGAAAGVLGGRGPQSQDVHVVVAVPLPQGRHARRVGPGEAVAAGAVTLWRGRQFGSAPRPPCPPPLSARRLTARQGHSPV